MLGARGGGGGGGAVACLQISCDMWVVKICIDMRENHMNMEDFFIKKLYGIIMLLEV